MDEHAASAGQDRLLFEAVLRPRRSLGRGALLGVLGGLAAMSLLVSVLMARLGAWPVIGWNGAAIGLVALLFWLNHRAGRAHEIIRLSERELRVTRVTASGWREDIALPAAWADVRLEERPGTMPLLLLGTREARVEVGRQLGEAQKRALAAALNRVLHNWRHPEFGEGEG